MNKEEIIDLFGNVLLGIVCPFVFLVSENPFKDLSGIITEEKEHEQVD